MIYDRTSIVEQFRGLIGFRPTYDSSNTIAKVDSSLAQSYSGQYINEFHSFFTPEILSSVSDNFLEFSVRPYVGGDAYVKGDVVNYNGDIYQALQATTGNSPATSTDHWRKTTLLSIWIQNKYDAAVLSTVDAMFEANRLDQYSKQLVASMALYDAEGSKSNTITKSSRFVGYEIDITQANLAVTLQRVGLQITGDTPTEVPIWIRYNGEDTEVPLTFTGKGRFNYNDIPAMTFYYGMGPIQIGYYEDDLGANSAISLTSDVFSQNPCYACGSSETGRRGTWGKYIDVIPFSEDSDGNVTENYATNFGLNLAMSYRCDLSDIIIREKVSFIPALKAMLRVSFLEALAANTRNNREADQTHILAYNQLNDNTDYFSPRNELKRAIKSLQFEMSGINPLCMPCNNKIRITNRVI